MFNHYSFITAGLLRGYINQVVSDNDFGNGRKISEKHDLSYLYGMKTKRALALKQMRKYS